MRPRKKQRELPSCVYRRHGAYYLVKRGKWTRLSDRLSEALLEYARLMSLPDHGMPALIQKALPAILEGRAESTQAQYRDMAARLQHVFADFMPEQVRHGDVVQMMDAFTPSVANRMLTVLSLIFQWAMDRELVYQNPCQSVKRKAQKSRERLITEGEFRAIYAQAGERLRVIMDLCSLTGQRIGDVLNMQREQLIEDGVWFTQEKTGKRLIVEWTPELRDAIARAGRTNPVVSANLVLCTRGGEPLKHSNVWRDFKRAARAAGVEDVTLHDLRAMSGTMAEQQGLDPQALLGHTDRRTTQIYLRDRTAKVVRGPRKSTKTA